MHRARLRKNNKLVAVKILHPNTQMKVQVDIAILKALARIVQSIYSYE